MNEVSNMVATLGFPITLCIAMLVFFYKKLWPRIETTLDRVTRTNEELSESNRILSTQVLQRLDNIDEKVEEIKNEKGVKENERVPKKIQKHRNSN